MGVLKNKHKAEVHPGHLTGPKEEEEEEEEEEENEKEEEEMGVRGQPNPRYPLQRRLGWTL
jgi:hypothetical protein